MTRWYRFRQTWYQFWAIVYTLNRHAELGRLIAWAYRKQLRGPLRGYRNRRLQEEERLVRYAIHFPRLLKLARWLHRVSNLISPAPRYPATGSAAHYRFHRPQPTAKTVISL